MAAKLARPLVPFVERELRRRQRALRDSDAVIAVSHYVAETLRGVVHSSKLNVVPNLIDIDETRRLVESDGRTPQATRYLLFIGKLNELKGAHLLPEILKRAHVAMPLVVVGDGPLTAMLASLPNVQVRGWLSNQESLHLLARATALLFVGALFFAYFIFPLVRRLNERLPLVWSIVLVYLLIGVLAAAVMQLLVPALVTDIQGAVKSFPTVVTKISAVIQDMSLIHI